MKGAARSPGPARHWRNDFSTASYPSGSRRFLASRCAPRFGVLATNERRGGRAVCLELCAALFVRHAHPLPLKLTEAHGDRGVGPLAGAKNQFGGNADLFGRVGQPGDQPGGLWQKFTLFAEMLDALGGVRVQRPVQRFQAVVPKQRHRGEIFVGLAGCGGQTVVGGAQGLARGFAHVLRAVLFLDPVHVPEVAALGAVSEALLNARILAPCGDEDIPRVFGRRWLLPVVASGLAGPIERIELLGIALPVQQDGSLPLLAAFGSCDAVVWCPVRPVNVPLPDQPGLCDPRLGWAAHSTKSSSAGLAAVPLSSRRRWRWRR